MRETAIIKDRPTYFSFLAFYTFIHQYIMKLFDKHDTETKKKNS